MSVGARPGFGYVPALDGVRAVAVIVVVLFHAEVGAASGGFLGVSVFFTLSGFLITTLLIAEHGRDGRISIGGFYARRLRRLLPASLLCLGLVLLAWPWWEDAQRRALGPDVLAAVANVFNWRAANSSLSYSELFSALPSPVAHFWSLAIEEQLYLVLPLVVVAALRRSRRVLLVVASVLLAASFTAAVLTNDGFRVGYNGTHTRAAEVLVGVVLATVLHGRRPDGRTARLIGPVGLVAVLAMVGSLSLEDDWLVRGGLTGVALLSACLIVGALGSGWMATLLGQRPLVLIGQVSYGIYLFHWPLFLLLDPERTGLSTLPLLGVRLVALAAVTALSYRLLEVPVRVRRRLTTRPRALAFGCVAIVAVVVGAVAAPVPALDDDEALMARGEHGAFVMGETVLVVGNGVAGLQEVRSLLAGSDVAVHDGTLADCLPPPLGACTSDPWRTAIGVASPDLVVLSVAVPEDVGPSTGSASLSSGRYDRSTFSAVLLDTLNAQVADLDALGVPFVVYVPNVGGDPWGFTLRTAFGAEHLVGTAENVDELVVEVHAGLAANRAPKVLIVGDSTSLMFASGIDSAAAGSLRVMWAGEFGCPFVRAEATQDDFSADMVETTCPDWAVSLPPILDTFDPDLVVVVAGPNEMKAQRYPGDPAMHLPGSEAYVRFHDDEMAAFLDVLGADGPPVMVADTPPLAPGYFTTNEIAQPSRLAGWNDQVQRWDDLYERVTRLELGSPIAAYEAAHGSIRDDGFHPDVEKLAAILRDAVLPELLAAAAR